MLERKGIPAIQEKVAARVVGTMTPLLILVLLSLSALWFLKPDLPIRVAPVALAACALVLVWWVVRQGRVRLAAHLFTGLICATILTGMALNGGVRTLAYIGSLVVVATVAWLYGPRASVAFSIFFVIVGGIFVYLDTLGLLKEAGHLPPWVIWVSVSSLYIVMLGASAMPNRMLHQALAESEIRRLAAEDAVQRVKLSEEALRKGEEQYRELIENIPVGLYRVTQGDGGHLLMANPAAARMFGYDSVEDLMKHSLKAFMQPDDYIVFSQPLFEHGNVRHDEVRLTKRDGSLMWGSVTAQAVRDSDGAVAYIDGFIEDISDRKLAEEERTRYSWVLEESLNEIYIFDVETLRFVQVNRGARENLGYSMEELRNLTPVDLKPEHTFESYTELLRPLRDGRQKTVEFTSVHRRKDGALYPVEVHVQLMSGVPSYFVAIILDISERLRAEHEREKLKSQLNQAQKMESVGRLAGGVAHDFNNMLSVILGHTELSLDEVDPALPLYDELKEIQEAAQRSAELTRQLLAFARKQPVAPKILDLNETVTAMYKILRRLIGENIELVWAPGDDLWRVKIDPSQIDQILANLCVNARDAIEGTGKITIETQNTEFDDSYGAGPTEIAPGQYVMLAVSDDGSGIEKETLENIFEPFFTTKKTGKGTGLGLATVYGAVKQNNGFLNVHSELGHGATFKLYLPRVSGDVAKAQAPGAECPPSQGETILLVEDEASLLRLAEVMLKRLGYLVLTAGTPEEAIRWAEQYEGEIHLLMTDIIMPRMNGRELAMRLRKTKPAMKRLFMSGYTAEVIAHRGVLEDGVHFIQKPFSRHALAVKIREALEK